MTKTETKKLFVAIQKHDHETVFSIIEKNEGAIESVGQHNAYCRDKTPLMFAMQCEDFELAYKLMDIGANVRAKMLDGPESSVIQLAASFGHSLNPNFDKWIGLIQRLIENGANPTEALWSACNAYSKTSDRIEIISLLIKSGASLNAQVGNSGNTVRELVKINSHLYSSHALALLGVN
ncbi:ankyrin repeat domain-containing protein [Alteromonadaceae bacterium M269]|nr:ankyrin repeat domain-containing protein [Alteromonadaceae bacterium M269]